MLYASSQGGPSGMGYVAPRLVLLPTSSNPSFPHPVRTHLHATTCVLALQESHMPHADLWARTRVGAATTTPPARAPPPTLAVMWTGAFQPIVPLRVVH